MGWRSVIFGFAAVVAYCLGALAQTASSPAQQSAAPQAADTRQVTPYQLPARSVVPRGSDVTDAQPRYATMVAPEAEPERGPIPAPTTKVTVAPADTAPTTKATVAPADAGQPAPPPRYSTMQPPRAEQVTVMGLRPSEDGLYRLGTGDKLRVTIFNEADLSGEFTIDGQGYVRLPLVGPVPAAGITTLGLESRIADAFVNGGYLLNPRISVDITNYRPFYIIGEVSKPGEYAYVNSMTAPNAIALAGGFTDRAVESSLWIHRLGDKNEREFELDDTTRIYPGDVIRVERSTYWSIVTMLAPLISPFSAVAYLLK